MANHSALQKISMVLQAKAHDPVPINRGMTTKELHEATKIPLPTIFSVLREEIPCSQYGIYNLTPTRKRYALWGYSKEVMEKALAAPFSHGDSTGIARDVQAAEVHKLVSECPNPVHHEFIDALRKATDEFIEEHGLSVEEGTSLPDKLDMIFAAAEKYYEKESNNED